MFTSLFESKKILCFYVILSLIISSPTPIFLIVKADDHSPVWIDENKNGVFDDGEWNGISIQRAIENATSGDIIYVGNGTYDEAIIVDEEVNIRSEHGYENTIIRSIPGEEDNLDAITINSDNVIIENLTVTNGSIGIYINSATNVTIDGCNISLNLDGIRVYNSSDCSITNCHSHNNSGRGVRLWQSHNCSVLNCIFDYNEDNEITLDASNYSLIENNTVYSNNFYTLCISNAKYNTITNNSFSYDAPGDGICIAYDSIGYSEENTFYLNNFYFSAASIFMQGPGQSDKHNNWNSTNPLNYTYNGNSYSGYLGNYWSEQSEKLDLDGDGVADEGYEYIINSKNIDWHPLMKTKDFYTINSEEDVTPPTITISSPEWEHTYTTSMVWLNVSADEDIDTWWYNLDNEGNITFIPNITLNINDGDHTLIVYANDTAGNIGSSTVGFMIDATPPKSISTLSHIVGMTWINWTWDNPDDEDFSCVELYINGTYEICTTMEYLNKTGLQPSTEYTLSTRTRDIAGNYNETWVNDTATTENQPSDILYVNTSGWWFSNGLFHPSSTPIQSAIDNALDNCSIFIYNGSYDGSILVDKRLNITGMGNVTITVSDPSEDYGIKLTDDHISLGYIRLNVSVGYRGIWLDYVSNCRIFNVTVNINSTEGDTRDGIYLDNSQDNIIENTSVNSQGFQSTGIYNYYSDGTIIRNNTVYVDGDSADGIEVFNSYASVIGNTINISGISSSEGYGVYLYLPYNSTIENNIIMINLSESNSWNAYFIGGSDCIFRDNILSGVTTSINSLDEGIIKIRGVPRNQWPSNPEEHVNISIFLDISMESNNWLILNITYNESELPSNLISESTLKIWRYSEDWEEDGWNGTRFLDIVNNTVGVNITTSGIFAPLGETEDVTPPVLTILNPSENNSIFNTSWVNISIRSNEDLNNAVLWWNGTNYTMSGGGINWYYNMTDLDDGNYTYRVYGNDTAGNQNSTPLYTLMTDTIKPIYSNISQDKNNVLPGECVNISVLWRDENLAYAWLMTNQSFDGVSYWHRVETIKLLDKQNWSNFTITPSVDDIGHIIGWKVYANDTAGNTNITPISNISVGQPLYIIDWKPIAEDISDNVGDSREFNITLNQKANITWYINGSIVKIDDNVNFSSYLNSSAAEGYWNVTAYAENINGSVNHRWNWSVTYVDTTSPEITNIDAQPDTQTAGGFVNITCEVTDDIAVDEVWVNITYPDTSTHNFTMFGGSYYFNQTYTQIGDYYYFIWANDTSGNSNTSSIYTFEIRDMNPPCITNISANPNQQNPNESVNISCIVSDDVEVSSVWVNITYPDHSYHNYSMLSKDNSIYYLNQTYPLNGTYTYIIWVNDTSGNTNISDSHTFMIKDVTPPTLTYVSPTPSNNARFSYSTTSITIKVSSDETIDTWILQWNDVNQTPVYGGTSKSWTKSVSSGHTYRFNVYANDTSGNKISAGLRVFSVNSPPPPPTVPGRITDLSVIVEDQKIVLSWSEPYNGGSAITGYRVYRGLVSQGESNIPIASPSSTVYIDSDVTIGETYYYVVSAVNSVGEGSLSNEVNATLYSIVNINTNEWFETIQDAVDDSDTINGHTILVYPGVYTENVYISKSLTIRSVEGADNTIIKPLNVNPIFDVKANNVTIDGFTLKDAHGWIDSTVGYASGIQVFGATKITSGAYAGGYSFGHDIYGCTIKNNIFLDDSRGIYLYYHIYDTVIENNSFENCDEIALDYIQASSGIIRNNTFVNNHLGIEIGYSVSNILIYNNYFSNTHDLYKSDSGSCICNISKTPGRNIIGGPYLGGNYWSKYKGSDTDGDGLGDTDIPYGVGDYLPLVQFPVLNVNTGERFQSIQDAIDDIDTKDGHTILISSGLYIEDVNIYKELTITSDGSDVVLERHRKTALVISAGNVEVDNLTILGGIVITRENCCLKNCNISKAEDGIKIIENAYGTRIENCIISNNSRAGIFIADIRIPYNKEIGIPNIHEEKYSKDGKSRGYSVIIHNTTIKGNERGIVGETVKYLYIYGNRIIENREEGILLYGEENTIDGNIIIGNDIGVEFQNSEKNRVYNNYFNNSINAVDNGFNIWNISRTSGRNIVGGSYLGGNYWSDYHGIDKDGDELGDEPYEVSSTSFDRLPLMNFSVHNINTGRNYPTIQRAIEDPFTNNGDTIIVDPGIYRENIYIYKSLNISIANDSILGEVVVEAKNVGEPVFTVNSDNTGLYGFVIRGSHNAGILLNNVENCEINNNRLRDNSIGVKLMNSDSNKIISNFIVDNNMGLQIHNSDWNHIYNNFFSNNKNVESNGNKNFWSSVHKKADMQYGHLPYGINIIGTPRIAGNFWSDYRDIAKIVAIGVGLHPHYTPNGEGYGDNATDFWGCDYFPLVLKKTAPIHIKGNKNFTFENGVIYGCGTNRDPYGIDGYNISTQYPNQLGDTIWIENTDAHFVIKNCRISSEYAGIHLCNVKNGIIRNVTFSYISPNSGWGYFGEYGLLLEDISNCNIRDIDILNSSPWFKYGVYLDESHDNMFSNIDMRGFGLDGFHITNSYRNIIKNSICNDGSRIGFYFYNSNWNTLRDCTANNNGHGVALERCSNNTLLNIIANNNTNRRYEVTDSWVSNGITYYSSHDENIEGIGIYLSDSHDNLISNVISNYNKKGVELNSFSSHNNIMKSIFENNMEGVILIGSPYNNISDNLIEYNNQNGISISPLWVNGETKGDYNIVYNNTISHNTWRGIGAYTVVRGIHMYLVGNTTIYNNIITENDDGIYLKLSTHNLIYNNYFMNDISNAIEDLYPLVDKNIWNISKTAGGNIVGGPYLGGNYWSNYNGADLDGDKIGDTRYSAVEDYLPLVNPETIHIIGDENFTPVNRVSGGSGTEEDPYIIENLDINALSAHGIWIENTTSYFIIRNVYIHNGKPNSCNGIHLDNVTHGSIINMVVSDVNYGVYTVNSSFISILNSSFNSNNIGVYLSNSTGIIIRGNSIEDNNYGIKLEDSNDNVLSENILEDNRYIWVDNYGWRNNKGIGIILISSNDNYIDNNSISGSGEYGIYISKSNHNTLYNNDIEYNQIDGIELLNSKNNNILNNSVNYNWVDGVKLYNSTANIIKYNTFYDNLDGMELYNCRDNPVFNLISNNLILSNLAVGINIVSSNNVYFRENTVKYNSRPNNINRNIGVISSDNINIEANTIVDTLGVGITVLSSNDVNVDENIIRDIPIGVNVEESSGEINNNYIVSCNYGIETAGSTGGSKDLYIISNTITDSNTAAIYLDSDKINCNISDNRIYSNNIGISIEELSLCNIDFNSIYGNIDYDIFSTTSYHPIIKHNYNGKETSLKTNYDDIIDDDIQENDVSWWGSGILKAAVLETTSTMFGSSREVGDLMSIHVSADSKYSFVRERLYLVDTQTSEVYELYNKNITADHIDKEIVESVWELNDSIYDLFYEAVNSMGDVAIGYKQIRVKNVNLEIENVNTTFAQRIYSAYYSNHSYYYSAYNLSISDFPYNERGSFVYVTVKNNGIKGGYGRIEIVLPDYLRSVSDNPVKIIYLEPGEEKNYTFYVLLTKFDITKGWTPSDPSVFPENKSIPIKVKLYNIPSYTIANETSDTIHFKLGPIFKIEEYQMNNLPYTSIWVKNNDDPTFPYDGDGDSILESAESHHFNLYFVNIGDEPASISSLYYMEVIPCNSSRYWRNTHYNFISNTAEYRLYIADPDYQFREPARYYAPNAANMRNNLSTQLFGDLYPQGTTEVFGKTVSPDSDYLRKSIRNGYIDWWPDDPSLGYYPPSNYAGNVITFIQLEYMGFGGLIYWTPSINTKTINVRALEKTFTQSDFTLKNGDVSVEVYAADIDNGTVQVKLTNNNDYVYFEYKLDGLYDSNPEGYKWYHTLPPEYKFNLFANKAKDPTKAIPHMKAVLGVKWSLWANELKLGLMASEAVINIILDKLTGGAIEVEFADKLMGTTNTLLLLMNAIESVENDVYPVVRIDGVNISTQELVDQGLDKNYFNRISNGDINSSMVTKFIDVMVHNENLQKLFGREILKMMAYQLGLTDLYNKMNEPGEASEEAFDEFTEELLDQLQEEEKLTEEQAEKISTTITAMKTFVDLGEWGYNNIMASGAEEVTINILDPPSNFTTEFEVKKIPYFGGVSNQNINGTGNVTLEFLSDRLVKINGRYTAERDLNSLPLDKIRKMIITLNGTRQDKVMNGTVYLEIIPEVSQALNASIAFRNPQIQKMFINPYFKEIRDISIETEGDRIIITGRGILKSEPDDQSIYGEIIIDQKIIANITKIGRYIDEEDNLNLSFGSMIGIPLNRTTLNIVVRDGDNFESSLPFIKHNNTYTLSYLPEELSVVYTPREIDNGIAYILIVISIILVLLGGMILYKKRLKGF